MRSEAHRHDTHTGSLPRLESLERLILAEEAVSPMDRDLEAREIRAGRGGRQVLSEPAPIGVRCLACWPSPPLLARRQPPW